MHQYTAYENLQTPAILRDTILYDLEMVRSGCQIFIWCTPRESIVVKPTSTVAATTCPHYYLLLPTNFSGKLHADKDTLEIILIARTEMCVFYL